MKIVLITILGLMIRPVHSQVIKNSPGNSENLTDSQRIESERYLHQGLLTREMLSGCMDKIGVNQSQRDLFNEKPQKFMQENPALIQKARDFCTTQASQKNSKGLFGISQQTMQFVGKAYGMIMGGSLIGGSFPKVEITKKVKNENGEMVEEKSEKNDYCAMIAVASETISQFSFKAFQSNVNSLPVDADSAQKATMYRVARSHDQMADNAKRQAIGWGTTAACYTVMAAKGGFFTGDGLWKNSLKLAASGFMTSFYISEHTRQKNRSDAIKDVANKLPGAGDCNPHTQRDCYCSESSTRNDTQYCKPHLADRVVPLNVKADETYNQTACLNDRMQPDQKCECLQNDSCFDSTIKKGLSSEFGLGKNQLAGNLYNDIESISRGVIPDSNTARVGKRFGAISERALAEAEKVFKENGIPAKGKLTDKDKEDIKMLVNENDLPPHVATALTKEPLTNLEKKAAENFGSFDGDNQKFASFKPKEFDQNSANVEYSQGSGSRNIRRNRSDNSDSYSSFINQLKNRGQTQGQSGRVLHFAKKAQDRADISQKSGTPIFDIISRRYQTSAWRRLNLNE